MLGYRHRGCVQAPARHAAPRNGLQHATAVVWQVQHKRRTCRVRAASPLREQHTDGNGRKLTAMPKLPVRKPKRQNPNSSSSSSSSNKSSSSPQAPPRCSPPPQGRKAPLMPVLPPEQQQHAQERTLAGLLAYSGLLGTLATGISMVCPGVDLFGAFSLSSPADLASCVLGLQLLLPCCLLTLGIMLPDYSSWKVPAEPTLEAQQKMAESLLAWTANKKAAAQAAASGSTEAAAAAGQGGEAAGSSPSAAAAPAAATAASSTSSTSSTSSSAAGANSTQAGEGSASSSAQPELLLPPPAAVSPPWMINNPDPPLPLPLARCKDALLMAQGHYLSATPRVALPWTMQVGVLLVNCMAAELLYRSVVLQVSGGWLTDRILEAGGEDLFQAAAAQLPVLPTPHMTGQLAAVALLSGAWGIAVARQVLLMSRRPSVVMVSQGKLAAGKLMDDVQRLAASRTKQQQQQQQQDTQQGPGQQEQQQAADKDSSSSVQGYAHAEGSSSRLAASSKATPSREAADTALAAAAKGREASPDTAAAARGRRSGPGAPLPTTLSALALSQMVSGLRDLSQFAGLGLAFALTGNLAAPFVAAVVTEGLMAVLQRRGQDRSRQRSIAFAKHFASFTRVFRDVQRQQQLKQQQGAEQQQQQAGDQQHQAVAQPPAMSDNAGHNPAAAGLSNTVSAASSSTHLDASAAADDGVLDAAVAAAVARPPDAAELHAAASGEAGGVTGSSRMERTITVLDQLLGEQLGEQAAAAGPHGK